MERRGKCGNDYMNQRGEVCAIGAIAIAIGHDLTPDDNVRPAHAVVMQRAPAFVALEKYVPDMEVVKWSDGNHIDVVTSTMRAVAATLRAQSCRDLTAVTTDTHSITAPASAQAPAAEPER